MLGLVGDMTAIAAIGLDVVTGVSSAEPPSPHAVVPRPSAARNKLIPQKPSVALCIPHTLVGNEFPTILKPEAAAGTHDGPPGARAPQEHVARLASRSCHGVDNRAGALLVVND